MEYYEINKRSWNATKELFKEGLFGDWIFRGQSNYKWKLRTTLEDLLLKDGLDPEVELDIYKTFQAKAHNYMEQQELPIDYFDWYALMQHYGAPTRLLDLTYSPYIACYFALEMAIESYKYACVYAINTNKLFEKIKSPMDIRLTYPDENITAKNVVMGSYVINTITENRIKTVIPVTPRRFNQRLNNQQGLFIIPGNMRYSFEENLENVFPVPEKKSIIRILIPVKLKNEILDDLHLMNITPETLFPGIDGLAKSMRNLRNWI